MGISWRTHGDGTAHALDCETFAEVVYRDDTVLVVNLETSMVADAQLTDALMDAIARSERRAEAEEAIGLLAAEFGAFVQPVNRRDQLELIVSPASSAVVGAG